MRASDAVVLRLPSVLTHGQAVACHGSMARDWPLPSESSEVQVDASALQQFDSSALAVLLFCRRKAEKTGQTLKLIDAPARLVQLARLYGVADWLGMPAAVPAP
jgi:phospholipid transport system transporter-binding protein